MNMPRIVGTLLLILAVAPWLAFAEDWAIPDHRTKELRLTLNTGEVLQGTFSAETDDKVMLTVMTPKGKNSQTIAKTDVTRREWVKPAEEEMREKLEAWPAADFEPLLKFGQTMVDRGYKKLFLDTMKNRRKDFTAEQFKLYGFFLINNEFINDAKDLTDWAKREHEDWKDHIDAVIGRQPKGPTVTNTSTTKEPGKEPPVRNLNPGQLYVEGKLPTNKELLEWVEDARKRITGDIKQFKFSNIDNLGVEDASLVVLKVEVTWGKVVGTDKQVTYTVAFVYTRRAPNIWAYQEHYIVRWVGFPSPVN